MSEILSLRSPLAEFLVNCQRAADQGHPGVLLCERPFLGYLNLRTDPSRELVSFIEGEGGVRLPLGANTFNEVNKNLALWMGPDEWLIVTPPGVQIALEEKLRALLREHCFSLTDVTHGNTTIRVSGPKAIDMLSKECSLNLGQLAAQVRRCAQTLLAKVQVIVRTIDDPPAFDLIVRRSFAEYLVLWLQDASLEYGLVIC